MSDDSLKNTILIVDNMPEIAQGYMTILTTEGYTVQTAQNSAQALTLVYTASLSLILLAVDSPGLNSIEICRQIKADDVYSNIPILMFGTMSDTGLFRQAMEAGAAGYIDAAANSLDLLTHVQSQLELARLRRENQMLRVNHIQSASDLNHMKDRFVRGISHDLKNAIGVIMGYAELLTEESADGNVARMPYYATRILRGAKQLVAMVNNLAELVRIEEGLSFSSQRMPLADALKSCVEEARLRTKDKNIELTVSAIPDTVVDVDPAQLCNALGNLLSNATKYTPSGGQIRIEGFSTGTLVGIKVIDSGLGIPPEDVPHVFNKFYRVNRKDHADQAGIGLGLYSASAIIKQHGGHLRVESQPGIGSIFTITLPIPTST